jgi:hypothetical protein
MNKAIATRLTRLERAIALSKMNILLVHGSDRATWPKPEPGQSVIYVPVKKDLPRVGSADLKPSAPHPPSRDASRASSSW